MTFFILMIKIPIENDVNLETLQCTNCLLPMQYQCMKDDKFVWQCFKCGKQYLVSKNTGDFVEESWSPPR